MYFESEFIEYEPVKKGIRALSEGPEIKSKSLSKFCATEKVGRFGGAFKVGIVKVTVSIDF